MKAAQAFKTPPFFSRPRTVDELPQSVTLLNPTKVLDVKPPHPLHGRAKSDVVGIPEEYVPYKIGSAEARQIDRAGGYRGGDQGSGPKWFEMGGGGGRNPYDDYYKKFYGNKPSRDPQTGKVLDEPATGERRRAIACERAAHQIQRAGRRSRTERPRSAGTADDRAGRRPSIAA